MSESQAAPTAPATDTSIQAPAIVAAAPAIPAAEPSDPSWLAGRIEQAKRSLLREMGVERPDDVKAALAELRKRQDSEKSETERMRGELESFKNAASRAVALEQVLAARAKSELDALTVEQRDAVHRIAGEDAASQINAIDALKPTWAAQLAAAKPAPLPAPANTTPATPPPAATASAITNVLATYEQLAKTNPMAAASYRLANLAAYLDAKNARG
jgi:hypothetical protein